MTAKEARYRTIESLSDEEARRVAETGEATINWDGFFAYKLPISSPPFALDLI